MIGSRLYIDDITCVSSKFGQCQPVMKNKPWVKGQFETEKYFEQERAYSGIRLSPAWRLDKKNEEAINSTRNMIINNNELY